MTLQIADMLAAIERNYEREGSGPGSRFEGRLLEDVQAEAVMRTLHGQPSHIRLCSVCNTKCVGQWLE